MATRTEIKRDKAARHRAMLRILRVNRPMTTRRLRELLEAEGEEFIVSDATWRRDLTEMQMDDSVLICSGEEVTT
ncbi:MAG: hypothetical protein AAFX06_24130 [Planctomycetota bacterium]